MRAQKPIFLTIPDKFIKELCKYLYYNEPNFIYKITYFYYLYYYIASKNIIKDDEYININIHKFRSLTVSNIDRYIKILINGEFIISDNLHIKGKKSLGYKLNSKYFQGSIKKIEIKSNTNLFKKISKQYIKENSHNNRDEPYLKIMRDFFMNTEIDYSEAANWIECNSIESQKHYLYTSINQLQDKRFRYFKRNKTNRRLDTNFTNLKSELRKFIKNDLVEIDLKNAQPFLFSMMIKSILYNNNNSIDNPCYICCRWLYDLVLKEFDFKYINSILNFHQNNKKSNLVNLNNFSDSVLKGDFYNDFIKNSNYNLTRKKIKSIVFKVMYSQNYYYRNYKKIIPYRKEKQAFAEFYPFIYEIITILKQKNNSILPIFLQKLESYIFIDCIAKELVNNNIIPLTIHDSVLVNTKDESATLKIINSIFLNKFNVIPAFHIKHLSNECKVISDECTISNVNISDYKKPSNLLSIESTLQ